MIMKHWKPFGDLASMHDKINRLFDDAFRGSEGERDTLATWFPVADIFETKDEYIFKLEVPGLAKEDINVEFHGNTLSVSGEKKEEKEMKKEHFYRVESFSGKFSRSFTLPKNIDSGKINANMKNGILELHVAKVEEAKAKTIPIDIK